ncbi:CHASE4 domain-containing protein [Devosia aurantiaca]|uniref:CHASE4 domain-containing protein n=1 Tax=Devosia aurantiaca TaxID=2714858 RepID=A0A6M1SH19_9HYPH|nr:CHASE4 domain-containing protein [Devosia aurantiaca]NGP16498.1 hypothetical protein [Devosia aurantiaca]
MEAQSKSLSSQIAYVSYGFAVTLVVVLATFGWWAASRIDDRAMARQTRSVFAELSELAARIPVEQDSSAIWDDSVVNLRLNNEPWIAENLAEWMSEHFNHDRVYLLNAENNVERAVRNGEQIDEGTYTAELVRIAPFIEDLRQRMARARKGKRTPHRLSRAWAVSIMFRWVPTAPALSASARSCRPAISCSSCPVPST